MFRLFLFACLIFFFLTNFINKTNKKCALISVHSNPLGKIPLFSQNYEIIQVGRELCRDMHPSPLCEAGSTWPALSMLCSKFWVSYKDGDFTDSLGSLFQCLTTLRIKTCILIIRVSQVTSHVSCLSYHCNHWKKWFHLVKCMISHSEM